MKRNLGIAFHCHHDILAEFVYGYKERVEYIKSNKPKEEQDLRLRLFKLIPLKKLPSVLRKAYTEREKADALLRKKADAEWQKADAEWREAEWRKADAEWQKAEAEWGKAYAKWEKADSERLHKELCPNCPFDGVTIFTRKNDKGEWY